MTTAVIVALSLLLAAALAYIGYTQYQKRTANNVQTEADPTPNTWLTAGYTPRPRNQGVLLAITNLPTSVIEALRKVFPELGNLSDGVVTTDEQGLVFKLEGNIATLTLWPFAEQMAITLTSTQSPGVYCTVSYKDGFSDSKLDELTGFYGRLSASAGATIISFAEMLTKSVTPVAEETSTSVPLDTV
jgi:hypothetical protein